MTTTVTYNKGRLNEVVITIDTPIMIGSEKQIAWAEKIYTDVICGMYNMVSTKLDNPNIKAQIDMIISKLSAQTESKFWIENRDLNFQTIYKLL